MSTKNAKKELRVLPTLNEDGTRRWLDPKVSKGRFLYGRAVVGWVLIAIFTLLPFIDVGGKQAILLDLPRREFTFFGFTFLPTDTLLLVFVLLIIFLGIFWITALFGRVWCGWGCPQVVYLEFLFRPVEKAFQWLAKRVKMPALAYLRYPVMALLSLHVANVFLSYFVGSDAIAEWVWQAPSAHPAPFSVVAVVATLMFIDFAWFREQMCTVICPYARLQSALLDGRSLIIGYDTTRGEPRGPIRKSQNDRTRGDCIDCDACVRTCPTGIDIRDGLQLECIGCAQCVDACDAIMDKIGKPRGLVRYTSKEALASGKRHGILRARVLVYPVIIAALFAAFVFVLTGKSDAEVTVLRGLAAPFVVEGDSVRNQIRIKVKNRTDGPRAFNVELLDAGDAELIVPQNPLKVGSRDSVTTTLFVTLPRAAFTEGKKEVVFRVSEAGPEDAFTIDKTYRLLGPQ